MDFALPRAGAISGQVVDAYGRPLAGMLVRVLARNIAGFLVRPVQPSTTGLSDDYGRYRAWGLSPGAYYVLVEPGTVPKTSSGKLQRSACRQQYASGELARLS